MYTYKRPNGESSCIPNFIATFFAVFLAGFMLLLIARWYIRDSVNLIGSRMQEAGKAYIERHHEKMKHTEEK